MGGPHRPRQVELEEIFVEAGGNRFFGDRGGPGWSVAHLPRYQTVPVATVSARAALRKSEPGCDRNSNSRPKVFFHREVLHFPARRSA